MNRNISSYMLEEMRKRTEKEGSISSVLMSSSRHFSLRRGLYEQEEKDWTMETVRFKRGRKRFERKGVYPT
jgi:hypothetical protein